MPNRVGPSSAPASVQSQGVTKEIVVARGIITGKDGILEVSKGTTPENLPESKAKIETLGKSADQHLESAATQSAEVTTTARATETHDAATTKENEKLKDNTAERKAFGTAGKWAVGGFGLLFIASLFFGSLLAAPIMSQVRAGLLVGIVAGFASLAISWFYVEIMIAFGILIGVTLLALLVWAVAWGIKNRGRLVNVVQSIDAGKAAGEITFAEKTPVVKAFQTDDVAAVVDSLQPAPKSQGGVP